MGYRLNNMISGVTRFLIFTLLAGIASVCLFAVSYGIIWAANYYPKSFMGLGLFVSILVKFIIADWDDY